MNSMVAAPLMLPVEALQCREFEHQRELAMMRMQLLLYRTELELHGIEPPDRDGADLLEMWRKCRDVIAAASECVAMLGTSKELLDEAWL